MLQSEFESRVGMSVTPEEYKAIEVVYMNADVDKDEFCKIWRKMNASRVKRAIENRKKFEELMALKGKVWDIYMTVKNIPYSEDEKWADEKLGARDIATLAKADIKAESYMICSLRSKLYKYLHA